MARYLLGRIGQAVAVVVLVSIVVFVMLHALPGGAAAMLGKDATPAQIAALDHRLGLDRPLPIQYGLWVNQLLHGDLGFSIVRNQSVASLIGQFLPKTLLLTGISLVVAVAISLVIGLIQALFRNRKIDYVVTVGALGLYATPVFFLAIALIYFLAVRAPIFPSQAPQGETVGAILRQPAGLVMPVATLALVSLALFSRYVRSSAIQVLTEDFVRTARATGAGEMGILFRHVLRNTLLPVITLVGLSLRFVFGGALIVESVFNYPGIGLLFWQASIAHDYPILLGLTLIISVATVLGSLLADVLYAVSDPRVRLR